VRVRTTEASGLVRNRSKHVAKQQSGKRDRLVRPEMRFLGVAAFVDETEPLMPTLPSRSLDSETTVARLTLTIDYGSCLQYLSSLLRKQEKRVLE
jgi:hypothetical protein